MMSTRQAHLVVLTSLGIALATPGADAGDYRVATGDKIRIRINEWPGISGEYMVGPASRIALPIVGELDATGLTSAELAAKVSSRLAATASLSATPNTSVEIVEFRPFFILGNVQRPGEYPFRPGLTVLKAISIAGGYYRSTTTSHQREAVIAEGDILMRRRQAKHLAAKIARLEAEQNDAEHVEFPPELDESSDSADRRIVEQERRILAAHQQNISEFLASLERYRTLYEREIEETKKQIDIEKKTYASVQQEFEKLKQLAERRLSIYSRQLVSERSLNQIAGNIQALRTSILRARQNISALEQQRLEKLGERTSQINADLQEAREAALENVEKLATARELLLAATAEGATLFDVASTFRIIRGGASGADELIVDSSAAVLPGDVLTVRRQITTPLSASSRPSGTTAPGRVTTGRSAAGARDS